VIEPTPEPRSHRWDAASDPIQDVKAALDDMAARGYGNTAMVLGERLGVLNGKEDAE
jgi:hypothetical protein